MIETHIRPIYQKILVDPVAWLLHRRSKITPFQVTIASGASGVLSAIAVVLHLNVIAVLLLLLSGYLDTLDGTLARVSGKSSDPGSVLDIVSDRVVEFAMIFALFCVAPESRGVAAMWMLGSSFICVTSFLVVGIFLQNTGDKGFHYSPGLMERAEAFAFFIAMILLPSWFVWLAWLYTILVFYTAGFRVYQFLRYTRV